MGNHILLFDDCGEGADGVSGRLAQSGFIIKHVRNLDEAVRRLQDASQIPIVALLTSAEAVERCAALRWACTSPMIVLLRDSDDDPLVRDETVAACLEAGADTVMSAALGRRELAARITAAIGTRRRIEPRQHRRESFPPGDSVTYRFGDLVIDPARHAVMVSGQHIALTPTEFRLLVALARRSGRTARHEELVAEVWGAPGSHRHKMLRLYISYLRRKLEAGRNRPPLVVSQRGIGYRLANNVQS
ncbi:MAG: response regulator transcription factor [Chloroflexi bacterium]|nr:response regulator transcription factor [Chloroflexota bacterium]